jgi:hypothetical protein
MRKKILAITVILLILVISMTLCIEDDKKPKEPKKGPWVDLKNFNGFLSQNFEIEEKEETGSSILKAIEDPTGLLYIVVGTDIPFTDSEGEAIHHFVETGGNLIVFSDNQNINNVSKKFGILYSPYKILDKGFDYNLSFIPINVETESNAFNIIVHSPRGFEITAPKYKILAESSEFPGSINSVLDQNNNNKIDSGDVPGPIPIIVEITVNEGKAIFVTDAGLVTDNLWRLTSVSDKPEYTGHFYQNEEYIINLVYSMHSSGKIIYDKSKQTDNFSNFHPYPTPE